MCFVSRLALAWRKLNACFMLRKRMACKSKVIPSSFPT
ncbi:Uncharacterised protein [Vibrio cholerae]|nr:Uncharacterised protein [Vibrio cholerae]